MWETVRKGQDYRPYWGTVLIANCGLSTTFLRNDAKSEQYSQRVPRGHTNSEVGAVGIGATDFR